MSKKWGKAGVDAIKKYYDGIGKGNREFFLRSEIPLFSMTVGDHVLRIMPPKNPGEFFGLEIFVHSGIGANKDSFLCTGRTKLFEGKLDCPACAKAQKLSNQDASDEEIMVYRARKKVLFNIVDMDKPRDGVKIWVAPITAADDIVRLCYDKRTKKMVDITDPEAGYDIFITREGEGLATRYKGIQLDKTPSAIESAFLDELHDLEETLSIPDDKAMRLALEGSIDEPTPLEEKHWEGSASLKEVDEAPFDVEPNIVPPPRRKPVEPEEEAPTKSLAERVKEAAAKRYKGE
jgi:hypothetical protein